MCSGGSPDRSLGRGTPGQDSRGCRYEAGPSGRMGLGCPQRRSTRQRGSRYHRLPDVKDLGIDTRGTYGPGMTRVSWVPEDPTVLEKPWGGCFYAYTWREGLDPRATGGPVFPDYGRTAIAVITTCGVSEPGWCGAGAQGARKGREGQFSFSPGS